MRLNHLATYPECRACDHIDPSNHVHHLRYRGKRGHSEQPGDLVTLCQTCHETFHRHYPHATGVGRTLDFIRERQISRAFDDADSSWI